MATDWMGLAANAAPAIGSMFGPIGSAVGGLAGIGLNLLKPKDKTADYKAQIEKMAQAEAGKYGVQLPNMTQQGGVNMGDPAFGSIFQKLATMISGNNAQGQAVPPVK
jgi:hypothetical protein